MKRIETVILKNLLKNEPFLRKAIAYLKNDYFNESRAEQIIFEEINKYVNKYKSPPSIDALIIAIGNRSGVFESDIKEIDGILSIIGKDTTEDQSDWIDDQTEKFCQDRALYNAIHESIQIMDGKGDKDKGSIPDLLTKALSVSFDPNVGHDYLENTDERYEYYHRTSTKYRFHVDKFNLATNGGVEAKTLNVFLAGPKVGKSLIMCSLAAGFMEAGLDVLYITLEMAEEKISQRIDANLLDVPIKELNLLSKEEYDHKITRMKTKVKGKLIVKEYPTASANVLHFRALMNELLLKKKFKPKIVFIDYLNICTSSRLKLGSSVNSYSYVKSICEELRGFAVEFNLPLFSATQLTRAGYKNSDPEMDDTSESFGLPATVDELWAVTSTDELKAINRLAFKKLATRSSDVSENKRWVTGVNYGKMKIYDAEEDEPGLVNDGYQQITRSKTNDKLRTMLENIDSETGEIIN